MKRDDLPRVLRRRSWLFFLPIPLPMIFFPQWIMVNEGGFTDPENWMAQALLLAVAFVCWRVATCKIVLSDGYLTVDNPVKSHTVQYSAIVSVSGNPGQAVGLVAVDGSEIRSFAFGGSVVDLIFKTTPRAAEEIVTRIPRGGAPRAKADCVTSSLRRCLPADVALGLAVAAVLVAAVLAL